MKTVMTGCFIFMLTVFHAIAQNKISVLKDSSKIIVSLTNAAPLPAFNGNLAMPVAPNAYAQHLGFFCKQEIKTDKVLPMPMRFRLGSTDYCNWLEQKPDAVAPTR